MSDKRPVGLATYLRGAAEKNDARIVDALAKLEDVNARGKLKLAVSSICALTGLSRNTIRNRVWALDRLKAIKKRLATSSEGLDNPTRVEEDDSAILEKLRKRIKDILEQNALLYEETLSLRRIVERKDAEIAELSVRKLKLL